MRNSPTRTIREHFKPIARWRNGPIPVTENGQLRERIGQPSPQIRELERRNRNLIVRVKVLQAENDQLNWWIGKFANQQREAIETAENDQGGTVALRSLL